MVAADSAKAVVESTVAGDVSTERAVVEEKPLSVVRIGATGVVCRATDMNSKAGGCSCRDRGG